MTPRRLAALVAAPALAGLLAGCVSLLPKSKPDQLYSLAAPPPAAPAPARAANAAGVLLLTLDFPRAATGDGILTETGVQDAYIAQSRWVGPASVLFREAVERALEAAPHVRLLDRGETGRAGLILRLEVRDFEAVYAGGQESPPEVRIELLARLTDPRGLPVGEMVFSGREAAGDNRVGPIVAAYNKALGDVLQGLSAWTDQQAASLPPPVR